MSIKYRTGQGTSASDFTDLVVKVGDTLPIGTEVDYDGQSVPAGWQEVDETNLGDVIVDSIRSKNIFNPYIQSGTYSGTTYTVASDGKITQSAGDGALWTDTTAKSFLLPAGTYTFSIYGKGSSNTFQVYNYNTSSSIYESTGSTFTYTFDETTRLGIKTYGGGHPQNYYIQIEEGTTATNFSQYQNLNGEENYSKTEQVIGTWVDGKPLYRTVINAGTVTTSNTTIGNIPNIDKLVSIKGSAYSSQFNQKYGIPNVHSDMAAYYINLLIVGDGVVIRFGSGLNQLDNVFAIVEYTKSTD